MQILFPYTASLAYVTLRSMFGQLVLQARQFKDAHLSIVATGRHSPNHLKLLKDDKADIFFFFRALLRTLR
jgi:hypothetical protein